MLTLKHCIKGSQPQSSDQTKVLLRFKLWIVGRNHICKYCQSLGLIPTCSHLYLSPVAVKSSPPVSEASREPASQVLGLYNITGAPIRGEEHPTKHLCSTWLAGRDC